MSGLVSFRTRVFCGSVGAYPSAITSILPRADLLRVNKDLIIECLRQNETQLDAAKVEMKFSREPSGNQVSTNVFGFFVSQCGLLIGYLRLENLAEVEKSTERL